MPIEQVEIDKSLIFTVTPGRSGTQYLTRLLQSIPGVSAHHEPLPNWAEVFRQIQMDPQIAYRYFRLYKLPAILRHPEKIYAETSHLTCKGFLEPMILMGLRPALIILRRPPRDVAWSYLERDQNVPARTTYGVQYLSDPRDPGVLPFHNWQEATNYQLCFWYALEVERRQLHYADMARRLGLRVADITNRELNDPCHFAAMLTALGLPVSAEILSAHAEISARTHNPNQHHYPMPAILAAEEEAVWDATSFFHPYLRTHVQKRYG